MFITLEGPDGSGKSTQVQPLAEFLRQEGYTVFTTREPGGTTISDQVREVLMRLDNRSMYPRTETLLFCAARAQLVEEVIRPRLQRERSSCATAMPIQPWHTRDTGTATTCRYCSSCSILPPAVCGRT